MGLKVEHPTKFLCLCVHEHKLMHDHESKCVHVAEILKKIKQNNTHT